MDVVQVISPFGGRDIKSHQSLGMERRPADEKCDHNGNWNDKKSHRWSARQIDDMQIQTYTLYSKASSSSQWNNSCVSVRNVLVPLTRTVRVQRLIYTDYLQVTRVLINNEACVP